MKLRRSGSLPALAGAAVCALLLLGSVSVSYSCIPPDPGQSDYDNDGVVADDDNCFGVHNPGQADTDGDQIGDACDCLPGVAGGQAEFGVFQDGNFPDINYGQDDRHPAFDYLGEGYPGTDDTTMFSNSPTSNYGKSTLYCREWGNYRSRMLVRFRLYDNMPVGAAVLNANLRLRKTGGPARLINAYRMLRPWSQLANWLSPVGDPTQEEWTGAGETGTDHEAAAAGSASTPADPGDVFFDLTGLVQGWVSEDYPNHGVLLIADDPAFSANDTFVHAEAGWSSSPGYNAYKNRPRLEFAYCPVVCSPEQCDGEDNDCDGEIDEENPGGGAACDTGLLGVCAVGTETCTDGSLQCVQDAQESAEVCDGLDNDCDGTEDDDPADAGQDCLTGLPGVCAEGTSVCSEGALSCEQDVQASAEVCGDGLDNDCDGTADLLDEDEDGVNDCEELPQCLGSFPDSDPNGILDDFTLEEVRPNSFAWIDPESAYFQSNFGSKSKPDPRDYPVLTRADAGGCSCYQILMFLQGTGYLGEASGHFTHGCSKSVMEAFLTEIGAGHLLPLPAAKSLK